MAESTEQYRARINQLKTSIENEPLIKKMRDDIAEGISKTGNRQADIEDQFKDVIEGTTGKDVISAPEIIAARKGEASLNARLTKNEQETTEQFQQKASISYIDAILLDIAKGGPQGPFMSLDALYSHDFKDGKDGTWLVFDATFGDGAHSFMWDSTNLKWKDLGLYQASGVNPKDVYKILGINNDIPELENKVKNGDMSKGVEGWSDLEKGTLTIQNGFLRAQGAIDGNVFIGKWDNWNIKAGSIIYVNMKIRASKDSTISFRLSKDSDFLTLDGTTIIDITENTKEVSFITKSTMQVGGFRLKNDIPYPAGRYVEIDDVFIHDVTDLYIEPARAKSELNFLANRNRILSRDELLKMDEIKGTTQIADVRGGRLISINHYYNGIVIRTDSVSYQKNSITEVRKLATGQTLSKTATLNNYQEVIK